MKRTYLEEDLQLIRKYFPGARAAAFRTPFDLTVHHDRPPRLQADSFPGGGTAGTIWRGDAVWNH